MPLNYLDLIHALHVFNLHETSLPLQEYYLVLMLKYLHCLLALFPDVELKPNHHFAIHAAEDLKLLGPLYAQSTPVFECLNHTLQQTNTNRILGVVEEIMLNSYCHQGNLDLLLEHDIQDMDSVIEVLDAIQREDHRGIFAGTDFSVLASTRFQSTPVTLPQHYLDLIVDCLFQTYSVNCSHWAGKVFCSALNLSGFVIGRVTFSSKLHDSAVIFKDNGGIHAGTILQIISHTHPEPPIQSIKRPYSSVSAPWNPFPLKMICTENSTVAGC
ncbi:hypothetical protein GYMLUDRAFT_64142 [Collybiopsis luxurians FD-317 M1]|uniref:Uncharacterized protein n=1 Tax=Collybiopsis luxurians FD-317 M1 TaxID=944289 RepID=A0A0D0BDL4_9AGAR|nr:hypothetical protein GYMLUDRAFT_64142 [Collybiopsis luxurians FD-317 M1]